MLQEAVVSAILVVLLVFFIDPLQAWMPSASAMLFVALLVAVFGVFAGLVWRERAEDERDNLHRLLAGRMGFLTGAVVLVAGITVESVQHSLDPWLVYALAAMVFAKVAGSLYGRSRL